MWSLKSSLPVSSRSSCWPNNRDGTRLFTIQSQKRLSNCLRGRIRPSEHNQPSHQVVYEKRITTLTLFVLLTLSTVQRLSAELRDLESEQERYGLTWANRQDAFGAVVKSLEDLGQMVKEEKSEQERKDALRDDDGGEDQVKPSEQEDMQTNAETTTQDKPKLDPKAPDFNPSSTNGQPVRQFSEYGAMQVDDNDSAAEPVADERFRRSHSASTKEEGEEDEKDDA